MAVHCQSLSKNVFVVSKDGYRPILYAPLQGTVLEVNRPYLDRFKEVLEGNVEAAKKLGLESSEVERFIATPPDMERRLDPQWPNVFEPTSATIFLTHKCTLRCAYCYCHGGEGINMPWPIFERAVRFTLDNAQRRGRDLNLGFHGGDVGACWPLFQECVAFVQQLCSESGVKPVLSIGTNGFYTRRQALYLSNNMASATVSIDGIPEAHDEYRVTASGRPSLPRILDSIKVFEANSMAYSVRMTVTGKSLPMLPESVDFICRNTHAATIRAEPLYSRGRATSTGLEPPDSDEFVETFRAARTVARSYGRLLTYSGARLSGVFGSFCSYPAPTFGVTPEGNLTCCYEVLHPDDPLRDQFFYGHIPADGSSVAVDDRRVAAIRTWAAQRRQACARCFCVFACAGDCAAKVMDGAPSEAEMPKRCHITRSLVYDMLRGALAGENPLQAPRPSGAAGAADVMCPCLDAPRAMSDENSGPSQESGHRWSA